MKKIVVEARENFEENNSENAKSMFAGATFLIVDNFFFYY